MAEAAIEQTHETGRAAGEALAAAVLEKLGGESPDALIVFATPDQDHGALLDALQSGARPGVMVGCSSAGEFTSEEAGVGMTCVVAIRAPEMEFATSLGTGLRAGRGEAAERIVE